MPKKIDATVKERALRMFADHRRDYSSDTALAEAVAKRLGLGRETVRRWLVQADIDAGARAWTYVQCGISRGRVNFVDFQTGGAASFEGYRSSFPETG